VASLLSRQVVFDSGLRCRGQTTLNLWGGIQVADLFFAKKIEFGE
jgi:hypothetical protein